MRVVPKVSVLIFLCTNWKCSASMMYIGALVVTLASCPYLFHPGLDESVVHYCCLCMVMFYNFVMFAMQENIEQLYAIKFFVKLNKSATEICFFNRSLWRCHSIENYGL